MHEEAHPNNFQQTFEEEESREENVQLVNHLVPART
jgi:hypothetical protein